MEKRFFQLILIPIVLGFIVILVKLYQGEKENSVNVQPPTQSKQTTFVKAVLKPLPVESETAEGAFMVYGRVSYFEGHVAAQMNPSDEKILSNGALVKSNGEIIEKDGTKIFLKEGLAYYFEKR